VNALAVTFTALLNVTAGVALANTLVAPLAGTVVLTAGGVSTVNEKLKSDARGVPNPSATCDATTVTVQVVPAGSGEAGVSVNVLALPGRLGDTVSGSGVPVGHSSLNAPVLTPTALLNVTDGVALASTLVAPFAGVVLDTVGGVSTVNEKLKSDDGCVPARSVICDATAVTVHTAPAGSGLDGVNANVVAPPGGAGPSVNATGVPAGH
jgi:hypothetical protein